MTPVVMKTIGLAALALRMTMALPIVKPFSALLTIGVAAFGEADIDRPRPVERDVHEPDHLIGVADRDHRHIGQRPHDRDVLDRQMSRPERRIDKSAAVRNQPHRQIMQAEIDGDLLEASPSEECCDRIGVGNESVERHAGGHADDVLLHDAFHEPALGHLLLHFVEQAGTEVGADEDDARIFLGELVDPIEAGLAHVLLQSLVHLSDTAGANLAL